MPKLLCFNKSKYEINTAYNLTDFTDGWRTHVRLCSALTGIALLFSQTAFAFDTSGINFALQAQNYHAQNTNNSLLLAKDSDLLELSEAQQLTTKTTPRYLLTSEEKDWDYLIGQTATIFGLSVVTVGLMTLLPESITKWDEEDRNISGLGSKWWENVSEGPVWDEDDHYLNYIMHPYFGGVYYTAARHAGFSEFESFIYSFTMSTFFWEYGVEAFAEVPSIQDIITTPLFGAVVGELMYKKEQEIAQRGEVLGSKTLANVSLFFLNPVGHIHYWLTDWWDVKSNLSLTQDPWFNYTDAKIFANSRGDYPVDKFIGLQLKIEF